MAKGNQQNTPSVKLPKNIRYWAQQRGFVIEYCDESCVYMRTSCREYTKGALSSVRQFRILARLNEFQICDGNHDRWANSLGAIVPVPRTREEFDDALKRLRNAPLDKLSEEKIEAIYSRDLDQFSSRIDSLEDRYGELYRFAKRYGRYNNYLRFVVRYYERNITLARKGMRVASRHRRFKLAELNGI